jgi:hypothetical protein
MKKILPDQRKRDLRPQGVHLVWSAKGTSGVEIMHLLFPKKKITYEENPSKPEKKRSLAGKGNGWG